jgi:uncharacterized protein
MFKTSILCGSKFLKIASSGITKRLFATGIGERRLDHLLKALNPSLDPDRYVFVSFPLADVGFGDVAGVQQALFKQDIFPISTSIEEEGFTAVLRLVDYNRLKNSSDAKRMIVSDGQFCRITLRVHSSLDAVGLTAIVSKKLTEASISANVIAAFYHDHVFVQSHRANEALALLRKLATAQPTPKNS